VKLLFLIRLLPLCEPNYNLVELGPRGTGKSYAYQELSPYVILLTGPTTVANLFYNMATGKMGLVGIWDAIAFDEVLRRRGSFSCYRIPTRIPTRSVSEGYIPGPLADASG
jgi:uncharacterized protein (TIGR02688 family)